MKVAQAAHSQPSAPALSVGEGGAFALRNENFTIRVVELKKTDSHKPSAYLLEAVGLSPELDSIPMLAERHEDPSFDAFFTNIGGRRRMVLRYQNHTKKWESPMAKVRASQLTHTPLPRAMALQLLTRYHEQTTSGIREAIAPTSFEGRKIALLKAWSTFTAGALADCKELATTDLDWTTVQPDQVQTRDIYRECQGIVPALKHYCQRFPEANIESLSCVPSTETVGVDKAHAGKGRVWTTPNARHIRFEPRRKYSMNDSFFSIVQATNPSVQVLTNLSVLLLVQPRAGYEQIYASSGGSDFYPVGKSLPSRSGGVALYDGVARASLRFHKGSWSLACPLGTSSLQVMLQSKAQAITDNAQLRDRKPWNAKAIFFGASSNGDRFFVDRYDDAGKAHYSLFRIPAGGGAKAGYWISLEMLSDDSAGWVFKTRDSGALLALPRGKTSATFTEPGGSPLGVTASPILSPWLQSESGPYGKRASGILCPPTKASSKDYAR